jgi:hypothetical protein
LGGIFGDILRSGAFLLKIERLDPVARDGSRRSRRIAAPSNEDASLGF